MVNVVSRTLYKMIKLFLGNVHNLQNYGLWTTAGYWCRRYSLIFMIESLHFMNCLLLYIAQVSWAVQVYSDPVIHCLNKQFAHTIYFFRIWWVGIVHNNQALYYSFRLLYVDRNIYNIYFIAFLCYLFFYNYFFLNKYMLIDDNWL